ncbi:MAG TPA: phosphoribosyltransferase, partial [Gemmatimonadaceae bacterium]
MKRFLNRREAGLELAEKLDRFAGRQDVVVLGLARGGVPVAYEVARTLDLPLDVFVVRKLGAPGHEELAIGAIATGGVRVLNREAIQLLGISQREIEQITTLEQQELKRRERMYRGDRGAVDVKGRTVIVVDDGLATGATMQAAITALRKRHPASIIVAAPVVAPDTCRYLRTVADGCEYVHAPEPFYGVGLWYADFSPTSDREVQLLLEAAARDAPIAGSTSRLPALKTP